MSEDAVAASNRTARVRMIVALAIFAGLIAALYLLVSDAWYDWVKALHILAVIAWMSGMLYLPRLFVYHADATVGSDKSETFKVMERRLLRGIINPAMGATWAAGLWLAWHGFGFHGGWLQTKIALVVAMSGLHGYLSAAQRKFAEDRNEKPARHWRIVNEIPTLLVVAIVILVVVKPF